MNIPRALYLAAVLTALLVGMPSVTEPHARFASMTLPTTSPVPGAVDPAARRAADDIRLGTRHLDDLKARYRSLDGVTVTLGVTPHGEEAVAYYTVGEIVVSRTHVTGITTILDHEIWHIIDWREDGRLDWGERLPPGDSDAYAIK